MKKDSLIKGTLILALAALIARVLGIAQRVPLKHMLGDSVMASFGIAYNIYGVLLIVATAGIPSALSKLISERAETGKIGEVNRIFRASMSFAVITGALLTVILYFGAPYYAVHIAEDPEATLAIRALAPALLLFPMIAMLRGYFQGLRFMLAGGMSQIVEQFMRVATAVLLAYLLLEWGYSDRVAVAGASFGGVMGSIGAILVMLYFFTRYRKSAKLQSDTHEDQSVKLSLTQTYKMIFAYALPITFSSLAVPIIYFIDSSTVITLLKGEFGYAAAKEALGILTTRAQSLAGIPIILAIAVAQSTLPIISAAYARGDNEEVGRRGSQAIWLSTVFGLWIILAIVAAARPVNGFIFGDTKGTDTIIMLTLTSLLQIVMLTSSSILAGLGRMKQSAIHVYIGISIKLIATFLLSRWIGMYGVIGSTLLCFAVISGLNFRLIRRYMKISVLEGRWIAMAGTVALSLSVGFGIDVGAKSWITSFAAPVDYLLQTVVVSGVTSTIFVILLFVFGVIRSDQLEFMPGRIRKLASRIIRKSKSV